MGKETVCLSAAILLGCIIGAPCLALSAQPSSELRPVQRRRFEVNDLFRLRELGYLFGGPYAYSVPSGALAVTILRPIESDPSLRWSALAAEFWMQSNGRGDIWVQQTVDGPLTNITHGASDRSGWFSPQWSPDGVHLGMLSTRGGELRLWTWNRLTGRLKPVADHEVTFLPTLAGGMDFEQPYVWLDSRELLCTVLPGGQRRMYGYPIGSQTPQLAGGAWHRYLSGTRPTESVIDDLRDSGPPPGGDLVLFNLDGRKKVLARNVNTLLWQPSPSKATVAFTRYVKTVRRPRKYLDLSLEFGGVWRVNIVTIDGRRIVTAGDQAWDVIPRSLRWSPDGRYLAYLGYASEDQFAPSLYLVNMRTNRVRAIALTGLNAGPWGGRDFNPWLAQGSPQVKWTNTGAVLVIGARMRARTEGSDTRAREDWWLISRAGGRMCLTCRLRSVPLSLWPEPGRERFFGLAGRSLLELDVRSGNTSDLTARLHGTITALISPKVGASYMDSNRSVVSRTYYEALFLLRDSQGIKPDLIDLRSHAISHVSLPTEDASVVSVSQDGKSVLYLTNDRTGLFLWRGTVHSRVSKMILSANEFLRGIAEGQFRHFSYISLDGKKLNAWILLPPGYRPGQRYPMIADIYPTYNFSVPAIPLEIRAIDAISSEYEYNLQIAASRGYAVLFPSIPVAYRDRDEVRIKVVNDVLPAVAAAVRRGFADPHRLAVWGESYGGEAVMGLIARTNRFKAAIASSGVSDYISYYGGLNASARYSNWAEEDVFDQSMIENGEMNLGGPPWKNWFKYIENSPVFVANRVHTPLLLTHGDLDGNVPMQQSEEIFQALKRQGKPVRLVRYWGEGHGLANPANIRDYWRQMFRWLELYMPPDHKK